MAEVRQGALFGEEKVRQTQRGNAFKPRAAKRFKIVGVIEHQQVFDFNSFMLSSINLGLEGLFSGNLIPIRSSVVPSGNVIVSDHNASEFFEEVQQ